MFLLGRDTVNGAEGRVFITVDGQNVEIAGMRNITANVEIQSEDMRVIGTRIIQNKPSGAKLSGSGNIYYGDDRFRDMVLEYCTTGKVTEFDIQLTNADPATSLGEQIIALYGCHLTGTIPIAILNDEESMLNYDFEFAFTRVAKLQSFVAPSELGNNN